MPILIAPDGKVVSSSDAADVRALTGAGDAQVHDLVGIAPILAGPKGRAWRVDLDALRVTMAVGAQEDGTLAAWIVEAPWVHPIWHSYALTLLHLRPVVGIPPPKFYFPGATHELWLHALNPEAKREGLILGRASYSQYCMNQLNFGGQFVEVEDQLADERVRSAVQEVIDGKLSADAGDMSAWGRRFGKHMILKEYR